MNNQKVSIIIVNYKATEKLLKCVGSIYASRPKTKFEIIVINNSDDGLESSLKRLFPKVICIKSEKNLGYGGGNNLGAQVAKGKYLFILNPDTLVYENTIDELVNFLDKNNKVGIVSPMLVDENNLPFGLQGTSELTPLKGIVCLSFIEKILPNNCFSREYWLKEWDHKKLKEVDVCPGTAFMISRNLFEQINGFDETFFLYFEENDVSKRVRNLGYRIYILTKAKIFHEVGVSTKQLQNSNDIFAKSRFIYFKKHFGILKALLVEAFLGVNKFSLFLILVLCLSLFLRIFNLANGMTFIGDQGWFYMSARDFLVYGKVPLVGITSSHIWLHQGPLWTYMLSVALLLSRFNPVSGGYLTVIFGVMTTYLMFMLGKEMFSQRAGLIAALLYASSPLIVTFDRMPFDPSPIPFFTVLYLFSLVKWVKGNVNYFPVVLLLLAILYNLELATFTLVFPFALIFAYGCFKKRDWIKGLFTKKIVFFSFALPILVMLPVIVYDFSNGFKQTAVFLGWTLYRPFSFLFHHQSGNLFVNLKTILAFCLLNMQTLIFQESFIISLLLFAAGICVLSSQVLKNKKINEPKTILLFLLVVGLLGIIVNQSPSEAYLPIVLPFIIFTVAILFEYLLNLRFLRYVSILVLSVVILSNVYTILNNDSSTGFKDRLNAANQIIKLADDQAYNLEGRGPSSQFASFTMNYEYLLWWKGHAASNQNVQNKIVVWESPKGIIIYKQ